MQIEDLATKQDLEAFKKDLLQSLTDFISKQGIAPQKQWLRTKEVRHMLGLSTGSLANLRVKRLLNPTKIEGVYYYKLSEIMDLLNAGTG